MTLTFFAPLTIADSGFFETLSAILAELFDKILAPVLEVAFQLLLKLVLSLLVDILAPILMSLLVGLLSIVDYLVGIFDIFAGIKYVYAKADVSQFSGVMTYGAHGLVGYTPVISGPMGTVKIDGITNFNSPNNTVIPYKNTYLTDLFIGYGPVATAFHIITAIAVVLAFGFTIFAVLKSVPDTMFEERNAAPVGKVIGRAAKAAINFLLIPAMVFLILQISTIILTKVNDAVSQSVDGMSLGSAVFLAGSMEAANNNNYNGANASFTDEIRKKYWTITGGGASQDILGKIRGDFNIKSYNYIVGFGCGLIVILIVLRALFFFVRRLFEIILLYLVSPFFVATMPIDDGENFKKWKDMFIAKTFSCFGTVFSLKLFLTVLPFMMGSSLHFQEYNYTTGTIGVPGALMGEGYHVETILKSLILIGGLWSASESQHMLLQLLSYEASSAAQESTAQIFGGIFSSLRMVGNSASNRFGSGNSDAERNYARNQANQANQAAQAAQTAQNRQG